MILSKYWAVIETNYNEVDSVSEIPDESFTPTKDGDFIVKEITLEQYQTYKTERWANQQKVYAYTPATETYSIEDREQVPATIDKTEVDADGLDTITISNLPNPTAVIVDEQTYTVTDGAFTASFDTAGEYLIVCRSKWYLDKEFTIDAS